MGMNDDRVGFLGEGSRLAEAPAATLAASAFAYELEVAPWIWAEMGVADLAHVEELGAAGVVPPVVADNLLAMLLDFQRDTRLADVTLDPSVGDVYNNRDRLLRERFGGEIGRIHTGRARREATTLAWHLAVRRLVVECIDATVTLLDAILRTATAHRTTVMPDFTYLQHAHPTSLAHYLLGFAYPVSRDLGRLQDALALVNRSPAGSGSVNGSRFPLDRTRMARSLEFDGAVTHTRDAMWAPDIAQTVLAALAASLTTIDRLSEELQLWCTAEFGFVRLADRHARTSVIMPQKQNPYALAMLRGHARNVVGDWVSVTVGNLTPSGQPDNRTAAYVRVPSACWWHASSARLLADVLDGAVFDAGRMRQQAIEGFTHSTDICDFLVATSNIDNRTAHRIVGRAVRDVLAADRERLTVTDLVEAAESLSVDPPQIAEDDLHELEDPDHLLSLRTGVGGAGDLDEMFRELTDLSAAHAVRQDHPLRTFGSRFLERVTTQMQSRQ